MARKLQPVGVAGHEAELSGGSNADKQKLLANAIVVSLLCPVASARMSSSTGFANVQIGASAIADASKQL